VHKDQDPKVAEATRAINPLGALQGQKGADKQDKYVINIKQIAKFVAGLGDRVTSTDIEEGMLREVVETPLLSVCALTDSFDIITLIQLYTARAIRQPWY
jgi:hypothetical protein